MWLLWICGALVLFGLFGPSLLGWDRDLFELDGVQEEEHKMLPRRKRYIIAFSQTGSDPDNTCDLVTDCIDDWTDKNDTVEIIRVIPQMITVPQTLLIGNTLYGPQYNYTVTILYIDHDDDTSDEEIAKQNAQQMNPNQQYPESIPVIVGSYGVPFNGVMMNRRAAEHYAEQMVGTAIAQNLYPSHQKFQIVACYLEDLDGPDIGQIVAVCKSWNGQPGPKETK